MSLKRRNAYLACVDELCVTAAWGSWADWVNKQIFTFRAYFRHMRNVLFFAPALLVIPSATQAQVHSGGMIAIDGDTLQMTGERVRLFGIDAPEAAQTCERGGEQWACGMEATTRLSKLIADNTVECTQQGRDAYGRIIGICSVGPIDLGEAMVRAGLAVALPSISDRYVAVESRAKQRQLGIWGGTFEQPVNYRAAHKRAATKVQQSRARSGQASVPSSSLTRSNVYFRSCKEAWAAGYAPMTAGQPGYRAGLDGDNDGIACEPYRRR